jgi:hypothetical protein
MKLDDMISTLRLSGVDAVDIDVVVNHYKTQSKELAKIDELLEEMGYYKIFTDELFGWDEEEDEYEYSEYTQKNPHKHQWDE